MKRIQDDVFNQIVINKSKFITTIKRVDSLEQANLELSNIQKKYYDATHNCYAYIIGEDSLIKKCSDDGEPSKTAGFPILDVLEKQKVTNILCVVTRYFGGTLLGASGLIKAYSSSTSEALKLAKFYEVEQLVKLSLLLNYQDYNTCLSLLNTEMIIKTNFTEKVVVIVTIKQDKTFDFEKKLIDITKNKVIISNQGVIEVEKPL